MKKNQKIWEWKNKKLFNKIKSLKKITAKIFKYQNISIKKLKIKQIQEIKNRNKLVIFKSHFKRKKNLSKNKFKIKKLKMI